MHISPPGGLGCHPFLRNGSVVVDKLFYVPSIVWGGFVLVFTVCPFQFCSHLDVEERAGCFALIFFLMSCYGTCYVALLHGAVGWTAVCDCGISLSYSILDFLKVKYYANSLSISVF